jgi:hypothetical protein
MLYFTAIAVLNAFLGWTLWRTAGRTLRAGLFVAAWMAAAFPIALGPWFLEPWNSPLGFRIAPLLVGAQVVTAGAALWLLGGWREAVARMPAEPMILAHLLRVPYGSILILMARDGLLPFEFAVPAGAGDILSGGLAPLAARGLRSGRPWLASAWNLLAFLDFVNVIRLARVYVPGFAESGRVPVWIGLLPSFAVPALVILHVYLAWKLLRAEARAASYS